ncbi:MAG: hypothetical protein R3314_06145 [Longimicrobiales bacterium]|nr:hypothetical protein [Longimicrobiales bacterium]
MKVPLSPRVGVRLATLLVMPLLLVACGDSVTGGEPGDVQGTWVTTSGSLTIYVRVTSNTVEIFDGVVDACFNSKTLTIVSRDGESVTLRAEGATDTYTATLRIEGDQLRASGVEPGQNWLLDPTQDDVSGFTECQIEGTWTLTDGDFGSLVVITETTLTAYDGSANGCRDVFAFEITDVSGDLYTLTDESGSFDLTIRNEGGTLVITFQGGTSIQYQSSTDSPSTLDLCGAGDDVGAVCADLPPVTVGGTVNGELTSSDPVTLPEPGSAEGWFYDLYGLTLDTQQTVQIDQTSQEIDSTLRLWSADGAYVAYNDDAPQSFDSRITETLDAGCYIVESTSWGLGETGAYTLTVN